MKTTISSVLILCLFLFASCHKESGEQKVCNISECTVCMDHAFQHNDEIDGSAPDFLGDRMIERTIVSPLVRESSCNYIVSGIVKYTDIRDGKTVAILDYGDGTVDAWAVKTIYRPKGHPKDGGGHCGNAANAGTGTAPNSGPGMGNCFGERKAPEPICCKFEQKCNQVVNAATDIVVEGDNANH